MASRLVRHDVYPPVSRLCRYLCRKTLTTAINRCLLGRKQTPGPAPSSLQPTVFIVSRTDNYTRAGRRLLHNSACILLHWKLLVGKVRLSPGSGPDCFTNWLPSDFISPFHCVKTNHRSGLLLVLSINVYRGYLFRRNHGFYRHETEWINNENHTTGCFYLWMCEWDSGCGLTLIGFWFILSM